MGKRLGVQLAALTREEWYGVVDIEYGVDEDEAIQFLYDQIDAGEFTTDSEYWEKGECYINEREPKDDVAFEIARVDGHLTLKKKE